MIVFITDCVLLNYISVTVTSDILCVISVYPASYVSLKSMTMLAH